MGVGPGFLFFLRFCEIEYGPSLIHIVATLCWAYFVSQVTLKWRQIVKEHVHHTVIKADDQIVKNGLIFIKKAWQHIFYIFFHHNQARTAGIFLIYACFYHILNIQEES